MDKNDKNKKENVEEKSVEVKKQRMKMLIFMEV